MSAAIEVLQELRAQQDRRKKKEEASASAQSSPASPRLSELHCVARALLVLLAILDRSRSRFHDQYSLTDKARL